MGEKIVNLLKEAMLRHIAMQRIRKALFLSTVPSPSILTERVRNFLIPCRLRSKIILYDRPLIFLEHPSELITIVFCSNVV